MIIDVLGEPCPIPVIKAKKALVDTREVKLLVDNIVAVQNLEKMAKGLGYIFSFEQKEEKLFEVTIVNENSEAVCEIIEDTATSSHEDTVVVIAGDTLGRGDEALGKILLKGFIFSLTEWATPPVSLIFLNSGAKLNTASSNSVQDIKALEEKGTKIFTCGTCADFYSIKDQIVAGEIADMFKISLLLAKAGKVINI